MADFPSRHIHSPVPWSRPCLRVHETGNSSVCFDVYQCDYKGFACKSELGECIEAYDKIAQDEKTLADDYEALRSAGQVFSDAYDALKRDFDDLQLDVKDLEEARDDAASCLFLAESLEIAKRCMD